MHLLCKHREPDDCRRELLFTALCKVIKQWSNSLYLPLFAFPELEEFRESLLTKFEFLFEDLHSQITTKAAKLIIPRVQGSPSGSPLTQLALTDTYQHQFLDDRYTREYLELSVLGRGGFGVVVKAQNRLDGRTYAIKIIIMDRKDSDNNKKLLREVQALAQLDHPNIVRYHSTWLQLFTVPAHLWPKGHAARKLKKRQQQPRSQCREKVEMNHFFPTSQVKIQEISSSPGPDKFEESSGGIIFMDGSRNKSNISKKTSKCKTIHENCEASFKCGSLEPEKCEESSDGIVFLDGSHSKSNISKKANKCKTIHENFESIYDSKTDDVANDKKEKDILKNSFVNNKMESNSSHIDNECVRSRFFKSEYSESNLATDSSFSFVKKGSSSSSYNGLVSNDDIERSVCEVKRLYTSASSSHASRHLKNSLMLCQKHPRDTQMTLFIQMGLCGETLAEWISKRNALPVQDQQSHVDREECLDLFRQILLAVQNIHSKNIIHRDLKPPNIFFTEDGKQVKLGDFGLARSLPDTVFGEDGVNAASSTNCSLTPILNHVSNTGGVGTPIYAAPELKFGGIYGSESDMHNLGIILLELFYPFHTGSERVHVITNLKTKRWLEPEFTHQWPDIAHWIFLLTDLDQTKRPTATALLNSELFSNGSSINHENGTVGFQASNISYMGETKFEQQHFQSNSNQNHIGNLISNDLKIVHTDNQSFVQQDNKIFNLQAIKNMVKENKEKDEEIRKLVKENKEKNEEIRKLLKENKEKDEKIRKLKENKEKG